MTKHTNQLASMNNKISNFLIFFFSLILIISSGGGADFAEYSKWTEYFSDANLDIFKNDPKNFNGIPLIQWQYGVGLLASIPNKIIIIFNSLFDETINTSSKAILRTSLISAGICLINLLLLFFIITRYIKDKLIVLFLFFSFFLFTPAGYYINKFSSENWSNFLILLAICIIELNKNNFFKKEFTASILIGVINYFLILVKLTNIMICMSLVIVFIATLFRKKSKSKINLQHIIYNLILLAILPFLAIIMMSIYHYTINNNIFLSPYNIIDDPFLSFNFKNLKIFEILFSPLHGMIFYHPFLIFCFFILLKKIFENFEKKNFTSFDNFIILTVVFSFLFQLFIQSAFFTWWLGTGTFGSRAFSGVSILIFYMIIQIFNKENFIVKKKFSLILLILISLYQSYILSLGETNFRDISSLIENRYDGFNNQNFEINQFYLISTILMILMTCIFFKFILRLKNNLLILFLLISLSFLSYLLLFFQYPNRIYLIPFIFIIALFLSLGNYTNFKIQSPVLKKNFNFILLGGFLTIFIVSIFHQTMLFSDFNSIKIDNYSDAKKFGCREWKSTYLEYSQIPNYNFEKSILLDALKRNKCLIN